MGSASAGLATLVLWLCGRTSIRSQNLSMVGTEVAVVPLSQIRAPRGRRIGAPHSDAVKG